MSATQPQRRIDWGVAGLIIVALLLVAAAILAWLSLTERLETRFYAAILVALAAALTIGLFVRRASGMARGGLAFTAGPAAPWAPIFASLATLTALFLLRDPTADVPRRIAVLIGFSVGMVTAGVAIWSVTFRSRPESVNPRVYADLLEKRRSVRTRLEAADPARSAVVEAARHLAWAERELGLGDEQGEQSGVDWASGYAYINVWMALHRAEESLLAVAPRGELAAVLLHDRLRTSGSRIKNVVAKVRAARPETLRVAGVRRQGVAPPAEITRTEVAAVREAVNEFRDSRLDGLARARNRLNYSTLITAWTAFLVLAAAIGLGAPREAIAAGAVFFLVGALISLFAQLRADAQRDEAVEDFGMASARLRQTLVASGLAAIGGVVITALAADATTIPRAAEPPSLVSVFTVGSNPAQLLVAAIFGLSPQLLIERLTASADRYRDDLRDTASGEADQQTDALVNLEASG